MANNTTNFQTTQTFLIECSRADSLIDTKETADFNSKWSNATNFNLKRGDVVSVEAITLAAKNASGAGTVEFSGDKVFIDGTEKPYCDNKVLLEVMFYMNNNNTYSCGLPFVHPEGSFNNNVNNAQTPVLRDDGGTNYYGGLPCSFGSNGYMGQAVYGGVVNSTIIPDIAYTIFEYNIGTAAVPNFVSNVPSVNPPTEIASIVLSTTQDGAPATSLKCAIEAYERADLSNPDGNCNVLVGNRMAISTGANVDDFIIFDPEVIEIRNQVDNTGTQTGRVELVFSQPISAQGVNFNQFQSTAIDPSPRGGASEMGNIHYSNIDQLGMSGPSDYRRHEKIINLAANCFAVPQAALPAADPHKFFPTSTYGGSNGNATVAYDYDNNKQGFRNGNIREECNGKPYIWTRNDYFGMGAVRRNCKGFFPKLMPMTAFILLEADELFTDLTTLANTINDKLHEALSPFDNDISVMDNYMTDKVVEPNPQFKASSVVPVRNAFGFYPESIYNTASYNWKPVYKALWTDILPVKYGGMTKVQPANFQAGRDFIDEGIGRIQIDLIGNQGTNVNVNRNAYLTDMTTFNAYGDEARIGNYIYGNMGYKEIYKMMFGDRLMRVDVYDMNTTSYEGSTPPDIGNRNIGRPVMINTRLQIRTEPVPLPNVSVYSTLTQLRRFQTIFTNMKFPSYTLDPNGNKVLNYDPVIWEDLAESLRDYELYTNKDPATSQTTYATQKLDPNGWSCSLDCGITDDYDSVFTQSKTDNITPQQPGWMRQVPPNASINNSAAYGTGISNLAPTTPGYREYISPSYSQAYFGDDPTNFNWADIWNAYRGIGKLNVMTRYDAKWRETSKEFSHVVAGQVDPSVKLIIDTEALTEELTYLDTELMERLNLPFVPGEYTNSDGVKLYVCGWRVAEDYSEDFNPFNTSTFQLGCLCWGIPLGISNSLIDNHGIYPMNGDQNNSINPITETSQGNPVVQPYRAYIENQTPYVVLGANNPTFQYNANKNRFEFLNLQTDNLLSSLNTSSNSPSTNPQIGEKCGIIAGQQRDALFNIPNPQTRATSANNYTDPIRNQGIRAEIGGVSIFKIHLCPPDYQVPENINPVNYWDNQTLQKTEENRQKIIEGCVEASDENWEGCLLSRLGFNVEDFIPRYGRQYNRFSPDTYNNPNPNVIQNATKPLICNDLDPVINPALNLYYKFPLPGQGATPNGVPKFLHGFNQNQEAIVALQSQPLTATNSPLLTNSSFFLIYSDIVAERNYQSGSTPLPCVFYAMKNYSNGGYLYAYGSNYNIMVNQDRLLSQINTEIRNPTDGKLAKLSPNSTIIYKIQRTAMVPNPEIDVFGKATVEQKQPDPNKEELDKIFNEEKKIAAAIGGSVPSSSGIRVAGSGGVVADRMRLRIRENIGQGSRTDEIQGPSSGTPSQQLSLFMRQSEAGDPDFVEESKNVDEIPEELSRRAMRLAIQTILNKTPVPRGTLTRGDFREIRRTLLGVFRRILEADIDLDMEGRWRSSGEDAEDFLEELLKDIGGRITIGGRGQRLRSGRIQPIRSSNEGVVFATPQGLDEISAIITDLYEGRLEDASAFEFLQDVLSNGGILVEKPEVVDRRGRGIGRQEGAPITFRSFNVGTGEEVADPFDRENIAQPSYQPDQVLRTLGEALKDTVKQVEGDFQSGPVIEEYGDSGGASKQEPAGKAPVSSVSTEAFSSGRASSMRRDDEEKQDQTQSRSTTEAPTTPRSEPRSAPPPPPAQRRGDGDGPDDIEI